MIPGNGNSILPVCVKYMANKTWGYFSLKSYGTIVNMTRMIVIQEFCGLGTKIQYQEHKML